MPHPFKALNINVRLFRDRTFRLSLLWIGLGVMLGFLLVGAVVYRNKLPEIDWRLLLGKLAVEKMSEEKEEFPILEVETPSEERKEYTEVAKPGDGITHLARRALKRYLQENPQDFEVTPEHKIYIEDYLKDRTGDRWLQLGETLTFSEDLIVEAIQKARNLTPAQLENLKQFSQLVSF